MHFFSDSPESGRINPCGRKSRRNRWLALAIGPVAAAIFPALSHAASLTWDSSGTNPTAPVDGSGNWDATTDALFSNGTTDSVWVNGDTAIFGANNGAAGTVTVNGPVTAAGIVFNTPGSGNYLIGPDMNSDVLTLSSAAIQVNYLGDPTISADIGGTVGLTLTSAVGGTLTLAGINTYTGTTSVSSGYLVATSTSALGAATNAVLIGPSVAANGAATTGSGNLVIDANVTVGNFDVFGNSGQTAVNTLNIGNGDTLTINGTMAIGPTSTGSATTTVFAVTGTGGTLDVNGTFYVGQNNTNSTSTKSIATADFTNLNTFNMNSAGGTLGIGYGQNIKGVMTLASATANSSNNISVAAIIIDDTLTGSSENANAGATMAMGQGTNILDANNIIVGEGKGNGVITFAGANGSVVIAGTAGGSSTSNITIDDETVSSASGASSSLNLAGHMATVQAGTLIMGESTGTNTAGAVGAIITFDTGTFNVSSLQMGDDFQSTNTAAFSGQFTLGSSPTSTGVLTIGAAGTPGTFLLGNNVNTTSSATVTATLDILGGTANVFAPITSTAVKGSVNGTIVLAGGTLNMEGNPIGSATSGSGFVTVTMPGGGQSASILNLGGGGVDNSGLNMNGGGTLIVAGVSSTYTGATNLSNGTLQLGGSVPNSQLDFTGGNVAFTSGIGSVAVGGLGGSGSLALSDLSGGAVALTIGKVGGTFSNSITGNGSLIMAGTSGTVQVLTGNSSYSGNTTISGGTLQLEGGQLYSGVGSPGTVTISGGTLAGQGSVNTSVALNSGVISPDAGSTLNLNSLTVSGGTLDFTLSGNSMSLIDDSGAADLNSGALSFAFNQNTPQAGTYTILQSNSLLNHISLASQLYRGTDFQPFISGNDLEVVVSGTPSNLLWLGTSSSGGIWDVATTAAWTNQTSGLSPSLFHNLDAVTFDDTAKGFTVNINGQVQPSTVTFSNNNSSYLITTSTGGGIAGPTGVNLTGNGTVTIATVNSYTGDTDINSGTLIVGSGGSISDTNANISNGALTVANGGTMTAPNVNINNGTFTVAATGTIGTADNLDINTGIAGFASSQSLLTLNGNNNSTLSIAGTLTVNDGGTFGGPITSTGGLTVAGATLVLNGPSTYSGATTINPGATLQIDSGNSSGSLNAASAITDNGTLIYDRGDNPTVGNSISGTGTLQQLGGGTLTLTGNNTYSGGTSILNGSLQVNPGSNLGAAAGTLVLGAPQSPTGVANTTQTGNLILQTNVTVGTFSSTSNNSSADDLFIAPGVTLTDTGPFTVGALNSTTTTQVFIGALTAFGGGSLVVNGAGAVNIGQASSNSGGKDTTTVDFTGLNNVTINTTGTVGVGLGTNSRGFLSLADTTEGTLAPVNSINASDIEIGNSENNNQTGSSTVTLGSGPNTLDASTIDIGIGKTGGGISFASDAGAGASLTIAGTGGTGAANITMSNATGGTYATAEGEMLLAGFNVNVTAGNLIMAENTGNTNGNASAAITFDTGTFVVQNLTMAADTGGSSTLGPVATLTIGGANANNTATEVFTIGSPTTPGTFLLGDVTNAGLGSGVASATLTINGGTMDVYGNIAVGSTTGTTDATLVLAGNSVLNMEGNAITGPGITASFAPNGSDTPTLENLGGAGVNGAGLTMNGSGTLILAGNNTYSGGTTITNGELQVGSSTGLSSNGPLAINQGTLDLNGFASTVSGLSGSGGTITNDSSSSAATLTITGNSSATFSGQFQDGSSNKPLNVTYNSTGTLTLAGNSSSTSGTFAINSGLVNVTGSLASGGNVAIAGGSLGGTGNVGNVTLASGQIDPGAGAGAVGALGVNSLKVSGGNLVFDISGGSASEINDSNAATFTGGNVIVAPQSAVNSGVYTLLQSSSLSGGGAITFQPVFVRGQTFGISTTQQANDIVLNVTGAATPASLIWIGNNNSGTWDTHVTANWDDPTFSIAHDVFYSFDSVSFPNSASSYSVKVSGSVNPSSMSVSGSNGYTFAGSGSIIGGGSLTDSDTATVILDTNNSYTGGTAINSGTLQLGAAGDTAPSTPAGSGNITDSTTLSFASGNTVTVPGAISGSGTVVVNAGTAVLAQNNTFAIGATVNGGALEVSGNGGQSGLGSGTPTINSGGTLIGADQDAFGNGGSAPTSININGGTVTDLGSADYHITLPNLTFTGGTLTSAAGNAGDSSGNYVLNGNGSTATVTTNAAGSTAVISAASISLPQATTFNVAAGHTASGIDLLVSSALSGSQPVTFNGPGVMDLDGNSTFSGGITISSGTLQVGTPTDSVGLSSPLGSGTVTDNTLLTFASDQSVTATNFIQGTGALTVTNGTVILGATNTFSGGVTLVHGEIQVSEGGTGVSGLGTGNTTIDPGTILVGLNGDALGYNGGTTSPLIINIDGGTLTNVAASAYRITLPDIVLDGGLITSAAGSTGDSNGEYSLQGQQNLGVSVGPATVTVVASSTTSVINAPIVSVETPTTFIVGAGTTPSGVDLLVSSQLKDYSTNVELVTKTGPGLMELTGSNAYTGGTAINGGTLAITSDSAINNEVGGLAFGGGTLQFVNYVSTLSFTSPNTSLGAASGAASTLSGNVTGTATALAFAGPGTLNLVGNNTYTGATTVSGGTLVVGSASSLPANTSATISAGELKLATANGTFALTGLSVGSTGTLDVGDNVVTISYGATDPIASIASYLTTGFNAGWAAGQIDSSAVAAANASQSKISYSIGYADGADGAALTTLPSGEIEILPTIAGDAKLQGNVVFGDFQILAQYFGKSGGWDEGNFKYGPTINFGDYQLLAQDFGDTNGGLTSAELATLNSFAMEYGGVGLAANPDGVGFQIVSVPEPASAGLLAAAGFGLLARRRRRNER